MEIDALRQYIIGAAVGVLFMIISTILAFMYLVWYNKARDRRETEKKLEESKVEQHTNLPRYDTNVQPNGTRYVFVPTPVRRTSNSIYVKERHFVKNDDPISVIQKMTSSDFSLHRNSSPPINRLRRFSGSAESYEDARSSQSDSCDNPPNLHSFVSAESASRDYSTAYDTDDNEIDGDETIRNGPAIFEVTRQISRETNNSQDKPIWYHRNQIITQNSNTNVMYNWPTNTYKVNPIYDEYNEQYYDNANVYSHSDRIDYPDDYDYYRTPYDNNWGHQLNDQISKNNVKALSSWKDIHLHRSSPNYEINIGKSDTLYSLQDSGFYEDMLHRSRSVEDALPFN